MENNQNKGNILVCLSSAPTNRRIIRTAATMARAFDCGLLALYVETPDYRVDTAENKRRLAANRKLAAELGAVVETVYGDDVPYQIAEYRRLSGVSKIVIGRSAGAKKRFFGKPPITEQLLNYAPEIDIHIIPDIATHTGYRTKQRQDYDGAAIAENIAKCVAILAGATVMGMAFYHYGFTNANIIMVYILGVLLTSAVTTRQIYSLISSIASVIVFNFFFTDPRFTLTAYETGYPVTFIVMFLTAYITGTFALRYKEKARQSDKIALRTKTLFDTDKLLAKAKDRQSIINSAATQVTKLLGRNIVVFEIDEKGLSRPKFFGPERFDGRDYHPEKEQNARELAAVQAKQTGATTDTLSRAEYLYIPMRVNDRVYGVVGVWAKDSPLEAYEHSVLLSILGECALALENQKNAMEKEAAAVLAQNEQLRANLLRSISHDLRTPLTTISGNASNLISNSQSFDEETKQQIYADIYEDSIWLINLVENLLYATKIEEGKMTLSTSAELLNDLVADAVEHAGRASAGRTVNFEDGELILVKADAKLIVQVIVNIIDNAFKYTPADAPVKISISKENGMAKVQIADMGRGIPDREKDRIFDKFYCGTNKIADNRRSMGLGLYLCKAIVEAHGGEIYVTDNRPQGAVFNFTLPLEEVPDYE